MHTNQVRTCSSTTVALGTKLVVLQKRTWMVTAGAELRENGAMGVAIRVNLHIKMPLTFFETSPHSRATPSEQIYIQLAPFQQMVRALVGVIATFRE